MGAKPEGGAAAGGRRRLLVGAAWLLAWMVCSSFLIIFNTNLYRMGFRWAAPPGPRRAEPPASCRRAAAAARPACTCPALHCAAPRSHARTAATAPAPARCARRRFPMMVTGMGQVFSAVGGWGLARLGVMSLRPTPSPREFLFKLSPIILNTAGTMFTGNVAYLYLSVAFIQILKAFTPAVTMILCLAMGVETLSLALVASILLIALGTSAAVLIESGTPAFSLYGFLCFMLSSATEAGRVVAAEILLGAERYNTAEALVFIGGPAALALMAGAAVWEGPGIMAGGLQLVLDHPLSFFNAFFISFLVNLTCFFAIQNTSSLTFKVAGCVKNVIVVWYGVLLQGEVVTGLQMLGYLVSVLGFALYSHLKMSGKKGAAGKQKAS
jgi:hypothetical protein